MFYELFYRFNQFRNRIRAHMSKSQVVTNAPVYVTNICANTQVFEESYGESKAYSNLNKGDDVTRLKYHIAILAAIANEYHQERYCRKNPETGRFEIKHDCLNKITRLNLAEFSLYTKEPLSMKDFKKLLAEIYTIAQQQASNVHLLLSTFSVKTDDARLLNICLYVQCGSEPKVESICKSNTSRVDVKYPNVDNFEQIKDASSSGASFIASQRNDIAVSSKVCLTDLNKGVQISNKSLFMIETAGGAKINVAIDICVDQAYGHAKTLMEDLIFSDGTIIPSQIDYIVTSNTIILHKKISSQKMFFRWILFIYEMIIKV